VTIALLKSSAQAVAKNKKVADDVLVDRQQRSVQLHPCFRRTQMYTENSSTMADSNVHFA